VFTLLYVFMCVYVCNSIRASVSGLLDPSSLHVLWFLLTIKYLFTICHRHCRPTHTDKLS